MTDRQLAVAALGCLTAGWTLATVAAVMLYRDHRRHWPRTLKAHRSRRRHRRTATLPDS